MGKRTRVLLVDDDQIQVEMLASALEDEGFVCTTSNNGCETIRALGVAHVDVVVLDLGLPDMDGLEVFAMIRAEPRLAATRVLMLTARGSERDRIMGLDVGADCYLVKPVSGRELAAHVRAVLRRGDTRPAAVMRVGPLAIDPIRRTVHVAGVPVRLRPKELDLLIVLAASVGRVWRRSDLLSAVWGYRRPVEVHTRTVDVHVMRLRAKLGRAADQVETVSGAGYRLTAPRRRGVTPPD
jgi:two-component system, OmpR family, phosphate regulon response regulator PhoB